MEVPAANRLYRNSYAFATGRVRDAFVRLRNCAYTGSPR
jgi:hypothetical protein